MEGSYLKDLGVDETIILKSVLKKWDRAMWAGSIRLKTGSRRVQTFNFVNFVFMVPCIVTLY